MSDTPNVPEQLAQILKQYSALQREERELRERKGELQKQLAAHMESLGASVWMPSVEGRHYKVRYRKSVRVTYDESLLRERLGDRYPALLAPDLKKLRNHLDAVEPYLRDVLDLVGSPTPDKVKAAIQSGQVALDDFKDAFSKSEAVHVAVSQADAAPDGRESSGFEN